VSAERDQYELADVVRRPFDFGYGSVSAIVQAVLDGGYRKPRTVTTEAELDALPVGSVVLFNDGAYPVTPAMRQADHRWYVAGCNEWIKRSALLPATIVHVGGEA
jgi:hypothetical protein